MALLFIDGFDSYATADLGKKWTTITAAPTISANGARGGGALTVITSDAAAKAFTPAASVVVGFRFKFTNSNASAKKICTLYDVATAQVDLRINADGTLSVTRAGTALTGGTSVNTMSTGTFYYVEFKVTIADSISANSCKVRVDGVDWITVATSQDTKNTSNALCNVLELGPSGSLTGTYYYHDLFICDSTGSTNNDFLGDCRVDTLFPTSDGNYSQFTCSTGSSHFALVDEATPNTSDYNSDATAGHRDSYGMGNLAALASQTVFGVQVNAAILKDDAGVRTFATFVRSSSTNADGATVGLSVSQVYISQVFETDPNGSIAWTETTVNAVEAGGKVVA